MADRPIIFSAPMIVALLQGRKTQTRRLMKFAPRLDHFASEQLEDFELRGFEAVEQPDGRRLVYWPAWRAGDRLWVREAFVRYHELDGDDQPCSELLTCFRADGWPLSGWYDREREDTRDEPPWRSPIHMPRALSRLTLTVTEVRVQRLQDISEEDAIAEGATMRPKCRGFRDQCDGWSMDWSEVGKPSRFGSNDGHLNESDVALGSATAAFAGFINALHDPRWNLKGDGIWGENPWVAAISFTATPANIDSLPEQP